MVKQWYYQNVQYMLVTGDKKYIYRNELDKGCFHHHMAYEDFKDLAKRTDKAFNIAKTSKIWWISKRS